MTMEKKQFEKLEVGDLILWHNEGFIINGSYIPPFRMELCIVTGEPKGSTLISYKNDDGVAYFSNCNEEFELIEKGAFKPLPIDIKPEFMRSFIEIDGIEYDL